ncbi:MAG: hypothetical protein K5641_01010 [Lachnospiraceae bacterium]|nr:hypothetical protein [Lachnospiraceae bacterium]
MIELFEGDLQETGRRSSKGNQLKWEKDSVWYKADQLGYEGLAECTVSKLLGFSSLARDEYVPYEPEEIRYKKQVYRGCKSPDFSDGWQIITLERLFKNLYGTGLNRGIYGISDHKARLQYLVEQVERATGLTDFGIYICKLFTIDAFFLNEDRHTHNISVLTDGNGRFKLCPVYDNGAALMSDTTMDYPLGIELYEEMKNVHAKTICDSFDEQLDIAEELYGRQIHFSFSPSDIHTALADLTIYEQSLTDRVERILIEQRRKYQYLFR